MKRKFRLTRSTDFKRVREQGKSYAHPLLVLMASANLDGKLRIGVAAGRSVGKAVERNRAKRRLRAAISAWIPQLTPGWDLIVMARSAIRDADFEQLQAAIRVVLQRAGLLSQERTDIDDRARLLE